MLQALLASANFTPEDLEIVEYPDAARVRPSPGRRRRGDRFANNEPVQLELTGEAVTILRVDDVVPLPGNGLSVGTATIGAKSDAIAAFTPRRCGRWTEIAPIPRSDWTRPSPPSRRLESARETQAGHPWPRRSTCGAGRSETGGLGAIEPADWEASIEYLTTLDLVPNPVTVEDLLETVLLPRGS